MANSMRLDFVIEIRGTVSGSMEYKHTIELLEDALYGAGTAAAGHGDIELILVVVGHADVIEMGAV